MFEIFGWLDDAGTARAPAGSPEPGEDRRSLSRTGRHGVVGYLEVRNAAGDAALIERGDKIGVVVGRPTFEVGGRTVRGSQAVLEEALVRWTPGEHRVLEDLHGPFSIALLDVSSGVALLAVDRIAGRLPLSWARIGHGVVFGSDSRAVVKHPRVSSELDRQAMYNYVYFHVVPAPRTAFRDVRRLQPGTCLRHSPADSAVAPYWTPRFTEHPTSDLQGLEEEFRSTLRDSVAQCLDGERVGCYLSGGTDSSSIAGMLREITGEAPLAFSIGFRAEGFDEMEYARIAARRFGVDHREHYVGPDDVVQAVPIVAATFDAPFGNASAVPSYFCARFAREAGATTLLGGDGGDELFAGNERYATQRVFERYWRVPAWLRTGLLEPMSAGPSAIDSLWPIRKARSFVRRASTPLPQRLQSYNELECKPSTDIFCADFLTGIDGGEPVALMNDIYHFPGDASTLNPMLVLDWSITLADADLPKVSRTAERSGVRVLYPFLSDSMVDLSTRVPSAWKLKGDRLRWFFKHALRDFLPQEILTKAKHGFGLPFGVWMRDHRGLAELAHANLSSLKRRCIVSPQYIEAILRLHREEHANFYGVQVWVLMMLEEWMAGRAGGQGA